MSMKNSPYIKAPSFTASCTSVIRSNPIHFHPKKKHLGVENQQIYCLKKVFQFEKSTKFLIYNLQDTK